MSDNAKIVVGCLLMLAGGGALLGIFLNSRFLLIMFLYMPEDKAYLLTSVVFYAPIMGLYFGAKLYRSART